jgi:hypothetical protein
MKDRPGAHHSFGSKEEIFDLQEIPIAKNSSEWRELGIGSQNEDTIEARFFGKLAGVDLEDAF